MTARFSMWVQRQPMLAYYILTFVITWAGWLPQAAYSHNLITFQSSLLYILGGIGPGLSAFIVMRILHGESGDKELLSPLLHWRIGIAWYLVALLGSSVIWLASVALSGKLVSELQNLGSWFALGTSFFTYLVAAVPEEVGWRRFVLPRLQARYNAFFASLVIGVFGFMWHIPLLLTKTNVMSTYPLIPYFGYFIALSIIYTWLYNSTRGSLIVVTIFHAATNTVGNFDVAQAAATVLVAVVIVIVCGPEHLSRVGHRITQRNSKHNYL